MLVEGVGYGLVPDAEDCVAVLRQGVVQVMLALSFAGAGEKNKPEQADDGRGQDRKLETLFSGEGVG